MSQTNVASGSSQAALIYGAALFAQAQKKAGTFRNMVGGKPTMAEVDGKLSKLQTDPGMPIVEIMDLTKTAGDQARMDCIDIATAKPIMGDRNAEGRGTPMSFSNMDVKIDQWTFPVNAGGRMSQQRVIHDLRRLARSQAVGLTARYFEQRTLCHLAGARGQVDGNDWVVPLQFASGASSGGDADFADIMVNPILAPTYNRHYVVNGTDLTQGGAQLASIASTDDLLLDHIDQIRNIIDNLELTLQPVRIPDDPAANDEPMWVMLAPPNVYSQLLRAGSLRSFQQNAINRAAYGSKHPLFRGEVGMWNGILVKKISRAVRFLPSDYAKIITSANAATATETAQQVNTGLTSGYGVERCIVLGAQALANAYGKDSASGTHYSWAEKLHNFEREPEFAVFGVEGATKVRFNVPDSTGAKIPTDHGTLVVDVAVKLSAS
jgi:N4-gp56 family major capsid protein